MRLALPLALPEFTRVLGLRSTSDAQKADTGSDKPHESPQITLPWALEPGPTGSVTSQSAASSLGRYDPYPGAPVLPEYVGVPEVDVSRVDFSAGGHARLCPAYPESQNALQQVRVSETVMLRRCRELLALRDLGIGICFDEIHNAIG